MKKILFLTLLLTIYFVNAQKQVLSENAEISIITIANGKSLYDSFGHSAIRVKDSEFDKIYNYGVFDFDTPGFYIKFMRGKLLYDLAVEPTAPFLRYYIRQNREIKEQVFALTKREKQQFYGFLENNAKPENKKYLYDFFFDNCATKLREVTTNVLGEKVNYQDELLSNEYTFRDLIYQKLDNQVWGKFGIDIALGSVIDRKASAKESTFLPSYVFLNFKNAKTIIKDKEVPLIKKTNYIYRFNPKIKIKKTTSILSIKPLGLFSLIALVVLGITFRNFKRNKSSNWLDFTLLFSTGLVGIVVFLLWFATDHKATANNFNIFWAFFPNVFVAFYVFKNKKFLKKYYFLLLILLALTVVFWLFKIQKFNIALIPILIMLAVHYFYKLRDFKRIR